MRNKLIITVSNNISFDQRMDRIAESLSKLYDVTVVGTNTRLAPALQAKPYAQKRIHTVFKSSKLFYIEYNIRLFFYLTFVSHDITYSVDLDTILACYLTKTFKRTMLVFDSHEFFTELPELKGRPIVKKIWSTIARIAVPTADIAITVNEGLARILSSQYKKDFHTIKNVPKLMPLQENEHKENTIIYQGALNVGRGLEEVILSMKKLQEYHLIIAGDGPSRKVLESYCKELNLANVTFKGMLKAEELRSLSSTCAIGINLLVNDSLNYYYSLANKFFDYTQVLLPSINMNFPAYAKHNEQFEVAVLIDNLEVDTIVEAVKSLSSDKILYRKLKNNCREARLEWNWGKEEKKLLDILKIA